MEKEVQKEEKKESLLLSIIYYLFLFLIIVGIGGYLYFDNDYKAYIKVKDYVYTNILHKEAYPIDLKDKSEYTRGYSYEFVKPTTSYLANSLDDVRNIFYTYMDLGKREFEIQCNYDTCIDDTKEMTKNYEISTINDFVSPYLKGTNYTIHYYAKDLLKVTFDQYYKDQEIVETSKKIDELYPTLVNEADTAYNNILRVHDYIVLNTSYDKTQADFNTNDSNIDSEFSSNTAYGPLLQGHAVCTGYTEAMELFLDRMGIQSYRVTTHEHIWNGVLVDGVWVNLDVTWGEHTYTNGTESLDHDYFLISTNEMHELDSEDHNFSYEIYKELEAK